MRGLLFVSWIVLVTLAGPTLAQTLRIEVIEVHGDAPAVADALAPLVAKPGSVTAYESRLVIRATDAEHAAIEEVLREIDRPARTLLVSVRHHGERDTTRVDAEGHVRIQGDRFTAGANGRPRGGGVRIGVFGDDVRAGGRLLRTQSHRDSNEHQTLRLLEGRAGFISTGTDVPLATRSTTVGPQGAHSEESVHYRRAGTGFYVRAHVRGDRVRIDISTERSRRLPSGGGAFSATESRTTVSGRLGEWIEIAGSSERGTADRGSTLRTTRSHRRHDQRVWLKVTLAQ